MVDTQYQGWTADTSYNPVLALLKAKLPFTKGSSPPPAPTHNCQYLQCNPLLITITNVTTWMKNPRIDPKICKIVISIIGTDPLDRQALDGKENI